MRQLPGLLRNVALADAFAAVLLLLAVNGAGSLDPPQWVGLGGGLALSSVLVWSAVAVAARALSQPLFRCLRERAPDRDAAERAAAAALRLPFVGSAVAAVASIVGTSLAIWLASAEQRLPVDLLVAELAVGLGASLLLAVVTHALCVAAVVRLVAALGGQVTVAFRGTVRAKILVLGLALNVFCALILTPAAYARYRAEVLAGRQAVAERVMDAAAAPEAGLPPAALAQAVRRALEEPVVVLAPDGRVLARAGEEPRRSGADLRLAAGAIRTADGWEVTRAAGAVGFVRVYLPSATGDERSLQFMEAMLAMVALVLAGSAVLAWLSARAITVPFGLLGQAADRIASGDLTVSPPSVTRDEMGQLAADFRRMVQGLTGLVREVQAAGEEVSQGAREATAIGERVRRGALGQHAGVRSVQGSVEAMEASVALISRGLGGVTEYASVASRAVGELAAAFEEVQRKASELEHAMGAVLGDVENLGTAGRDAEGRLTALEALAGRAGGSLAEAKASVADLERSAGESEAGAGTAAELAERAGRVMEGTVLGIEALHGAVADAHRRIAMLGRRSDDIDQVVDFIGEVAGRTNLLSLNASIIAAQAGEHGKAFGVVADQIRELAAQIARSTKSIGDIVHAVREDVEGTAALIDRGDALAVEGVQLARNSLEALGDIRRSTARGRELAATIRAAVQAHALSSHEMSALVEGVADGSRAVATAVQLVGRSVSGVHSVSRGVTGMADRVARTLEEQAGLGRRQLENLSRLEKMIQEISRAVQNHDEATRDLRAVLQALSDTAGEHELAVAGLSGVADQMGGRAKALTERVNKFKV